MLNVNFRCQKYVKKRVHGNDKENLPRAPKKCPRSLHFTLLLWCRSRASAVEINDITIILPATIKFQISDLIYCYYHNPGLRPHLSTKWTGQKHFTNSQGTNHEIWMMRCSLRAPGFSRVQSACLKYY